MSKAISSKGAMKSSAARPRSSPQRIRRTSRNLPVSSRTHAFRSRTELVGEPVGFIITHKGREEPNMGDSPQASEKKYAMIESRDVMVPMRDGVRLAVDVFRPDSRGKFPALLAISPYGKGIQSMSLP